MLNLREITNEVLAVAAELKRKKEDDEKNRIQEATNEWLKRREAIVDEKIEDLKRELIRAAESGNSKYVLPLEYVSGCDYGYNKDKPWICNSDDPVCLAYTKFARENNINVSYDHEPKYDEDDRRQSRPRWYEYYLTFTW